MNPRRSDAQTAPSASEHGPTIDIDPAWTRDSVAQLFQRHGTLRANAEAVADHLIDSERRGLASHGLVRVTQYLREISAGALDPSAIPTVVSDESALARIDGHLGFGQVSGNAAARVALERAQAHGAGFVTVRNVQHTGRLGAYTETLARQGCLAIAFASGALRFHRVVPFGGREGRLSTNPIAWAAPMAEGVLSADFSTSATPEGRIRLMQGEGRLAPEGTICDASGVPTTDPHLFYGGPDGDPAPGGLLPLGGQLFGHKGYALGLLSECLATIMAGDDSASPQGRANNLAVLALRGDDDLATRVTAMAQYMKSSAPAPGRVEVLIPGDPEQRHFMTGRVAVSEFVWSALQQEFARAGLASEPPSGAVSPSDHPQSGGH